MLGIKSSGCFILGIILGFILALFLGAACIFYFNPDIKQKTLTRVEEIWKGIKNDVDDSIDAAKNAPTAEPAIPQVPRGKDKETPVPKGNTAPQPANRPRIEIKFGI